MIRRIWNAYTIEVMKAIRSKPFYAGPLLVALVILAAPLRSPIEQDGHSDYSFIAYATPAALNLLGFFLLLVFSAGLIAGEIAGGTARSVLVRPLRRREFVAAKALMGMSYAVALSLTASLSSWILVYGFGDAAGVRFGGEVIYTDFEMRLTFLCALALNLLPQFAAVAFALFISACTRSVATAVSTALGVWIAADLLKYPFRVERYLFSSYLESYWQVFADRAVALETGWMPAAIHGALASAAAIALFLGLALVAVARRSLTA